MSNVSGQCQSPSEAVEFPVWCESNTSTHVSGDPYEVVFKRAKDVSKGKWVVVEHYTTKMTAFNRANRYAKLAEQLGVELKSVQRKGQNYLLLRSLA